jgi:hypothetical protein
MQRWCSKITAAFISCITRLPIHRPPATHQSSVRITPTLCQRFNRTFRKTSHACSDFRAKLCSSSGIHRRKAIAAGPRQAAARRDLTGIVVLNGDSLSEQCVSRDVIVTALPQCSIGLKNVNSGRQVKNRQLALLHSSTPSQGARNKPVARLTVNYRRILASVTKPCTLEVANGLVTRDKLALAPTSPLLPIRP